jgi:hypothetical protein
MKKVFARLAQRQPEIFTIERSFMRLVNMW